MTSPWEKGVHADYTAFVMEVHVRRNSDGRVTSQRCLQDSRDRETTDSMGGTHGMVEGSWALLIEAVRSEAMLQLLVKLTNDPEFKQQLSAKNPPESLFEELSKSVSEQLRNGLDELLPGLAKECAEAVRNGLRAEKG